MVIVEEKVGDIFAAEEKFIAFAVNAEGVIDSGVAGAMFRKYPELGKQFPTFKPITGGAWFIPVSDGKTLCVLVSHTLINKDWEHDMTQAAIEVLNSVREPIAIVKIGTGFIGQLQGADWTKIRKMLEDSPAKFVIYEKR